MDEHAEDSSSSEMLVKADTKKAGLGEKFKQIKETARQWTENGREWFHGLRKTAELSPDVALSTIAATDDDLIQTLAEEQEETPDNEKNEPQTWLDEKK